MGQETADGYTGKESAQERMRQSSHHTGKITVSGLTVCGAKRLAFFSNSLLFLILGTTAFKSKVLSLTESCRNELSF